MQMGFIGKMKDSSMGWLWLSVKIEMVVLYLTNHYIQDVASDVRLAAEIKLTPG